MTIKTKCLRLTYYLGIAVALNLKPVYADNLHIAVAANFTKPILQLKQQFENRSGHSVVVSFGSTGQLYTQINHGAPYQVFLAADMKRPQMLINSKGKAVADSLFVYAIGQLVLWSPKTAFVTNQIQKILLQKRQFNYLAIAKPKLAPYGKAAKEVLEKMGLWQQLRTKLVRGNNISQTYQFVATGNADLGFIALSQYIASSGGSHWLVPNTLYAPIKQGAVLLKTGENQQAAQAFIKFLRSSYARKKIEEFGYTVPSILE